MIRLAFHTRGAVIECPRCGREWNIPLGQSECDCNCHLFCPEGTQPSDCSVTPQSYSGGLGWPVGLDNNPDDDGHDVMNRTYYCSIHDRYYYKTPIILEVDWAKWFSKRAPEKFRLGKGEY